MKKRTKKAWFIHAPEGDGNMQGWWNHIYFLGFGNTPEKFYRLIDRRLLDTHSVQFVRVPLYATTKKAICIILRKLYGYQKAKYIWDIHPKKTNKKTKREIQRHWKRAWFVPRNLPWRKYWWDRIEWLGFGEKPNLPCYGRAASWIGQPKFVLVPPQATVIQAIKRIFHKLGEEFTPDLIEK